MANIINFRNSLTHAGLNNDSANAVIAQGYNDLASFYQVKEEDINNMVVQIHKSNHALGVNANPQVLIGFGSIDRLKALHYVLVWRKRIGNNLNVAVTAEMIDQYGDMRVHFRDRKEAATESKPERPPEMKDFAKWRVWWEKWDSYMSQIRGVADIPLTYVYRVVEEQPDEESDEWLPDNYPDPDDYYNRVILLDGPHFQIDNRRIYDELKTLLIDGPGWAFIRRFERERDGRAAVLTLKRQAEGDAASLVRKKSAYNDMRNAKWMGPRKDFPFDKYVLVHQRAHNELLELGEPVPESQKVDAFLVGIKDPRLATAKDIVLSDAVRRQDFETCQQFLKTLLVNKVEQDRAERNVSGASTGQNKGKGNKASNGKKKIHTGRYSPGDWHRLTAEEKSRVFELRKDKRSGKPNESGNGKRNVSDVSRDARAENAENSDDGGDAQESAAKDAGNQFGSSAQGRGKKNKAN